MNLSGNMSPSFRWKLSRHIWRCGLGHCIMFSPEAPCTTYLITIISPSFRVSLLSIFTSTSLIIWKKHKYCIMLHYLALHCRDGNVIFLLTFPDASQLQFWQREYSKKICTKYGQKMEIGCFDIFDCWRREIIVFCVYSYREPKHQRHVRIRITGKEFWDD